MKLIPVLILLATISSCQQQQGERFPELPFFALYHQNDAARYEAPDVLQLDVQINVHELDCGAPDCYGHDMAVYMQLEEDSTGCYIAKVSSTNTTFTCEGEDSLVAGIYPTNTFYPVGNPNLRDSTLTEIILHDTVHHQALILLCGMYYFYEDSLPMKLQEDWTEENFPAFGSAVRWWAVETEES